MSEPKTITVRELLLDMEAAINRMSKKNPHRTLLMRAGAAVIELAQRSEKQEPQYLGVPEQAESVEMSAQ